MSKLILIFLLHQRKGLLALLNAISHSHGMYVLSIFCVSVTYNISNFASQIIIFAESGHFLRFRFYATIGGFSSKKSCVSAAVNQRYYIEKCMRQAGFASNGFQQRVFSYRWRVVYIFSEDLEYKILRRFFMLDVRF